MKLLRSKRQGTLRGMIVRRSSEAADRARVIHPASELVALVPVSAHDQGRQAVKDAPLPSDERFIRQFLRVWTRRLMLLCAVLAIGLWAAVPLLSMVRIKQISFSGQAHYDAQTLMEGMGVAVGDELLACSPGAIQAALLEGYPYLETVSVDRTLLGSVNISVTERVPRWALVISQERVALVDASMRVLEIRPTDELDGTLCAVAFELFPPTDEQEEPEAKEITPGKTYDGNQAAINKLSAIAQAMQETELAALAARLDMSDPYAVTLTLTDGTILMLHECLKPTEQLRAAQSALQAYRVQNGGEGALRVDVDDFSRVTIRPMS